jgi:arsenate reductase
MCAVKRDEGGVVGHNCIMAKTIVIHGIKACDTMKKARAWLDDRGVKYAFHDYKVDGIDKATLERWAKEVGWEVLLKIGRAHV